MKVCDVDGCIKAPLARGLCSAHYHRRRRSRTGVISPKPLQPDHVTAVRGTCDVDGCEAPHKARGMCRNHYKRWQKTEASRVNVTTAGNDTPLGETTLLVFPKAFVSHSDRP